MSKPVLAKNDYLIGLLIKSKKYKITNCGRIFRIENGNPVELKYQSPKGPGTYLKIHFQKHQIFVHRIVYCYFNKSIDSGLDVNHIDGNPLNNSFSNLEQTTRSENLKHSYRKLSRKVSLDAAWSSRGLKNV